MARGHILAGKQPRDAFLYPLSILLGKLIVENRVSETFGRAVTLVNLSSMVINKII